MKHIIILTLLSFYCQLALTQIEPVYKYKNVIKLSPAELLRSEFQVGYERYIKNRSQGIDVLLSIFSGQNGEESKNGIQAFVHTVSTLVNCTMTPI